jgi:hypothetical protein
VTGLREPWVDPATIPELAEILRRKWLSKVRIYEGWCENGDRLLQVIKVRGRPLALGQAAARASTGSPNPAARRSAHWDHRSNWQAAWLDLSWDAYFAPYEPPRVGPIGRPPALSVERPVSTRKAVGSARVAARPDKWRSLQACHHVGRTV